MAQSGDTLTIKKIDKKEVPEGVVTSVERDFPGGTHEEWIWMPNTEFNEQYKVSHFNDLKDGNENNYYQVELNDDNMRGYAVYDKDGKLMHSREVLTDTRLPRAIDLAITKKYLGWKVIGGHEIIKTPNQENQTYSVEIEKGNEKRKLIMDKDGKFIKDQSLIL